MCPTTVSRERYHADLTLSAANLFRHVAGLDRRPLQHLSLIHISMCIRDRLLPALGAAGAARLQRQLTLQALRLAQHFCTGQMTLWCSPDAQHHFFQALHTRFRLRLCRQSGTHLGTRMSNAFAAHDGPLLLIGTDCPAMETGHLVTAANVLCEGHDAVFIPAEDGGYVLVGLRCPQPRLFENIDWGSASVMAQTREMCIRDRMNTGAQASKSEVLLFLHADTRQMCIRDSS